jgi:uncharacterized membrane protein YcaP (DUF421 family)
MNWHDILFGNENYAFLAEIAVRSLIMFLIIFAGLRLTSKRTVKQLSVFELLIIIALGSAAGDPMFYKDVGIVNSLMVFVVILLLYWILTKTMEHSEKMESVLEGKPFYIIREGKAARESLTHKVLAMDEFFSALRSHQIYQLGQVKEGVLEVNGEISLLLYPKGEIKPGLPVWPDYLMKKTRQVPLSGVYACTNCGSTQHIDEGEVTLCGYCLQNDEWVNAVTQSGSSE